MDWFIDKFKWMLLVGLVGLGYLGHLAYQDYKEPLFEVHSRQVLSEPYDDGRAVLEYTRLTEVHKSCPYDVRRFIIDADGFRHELVPERENPALKAGSISGDRVIDVPDYLPDGPAVYVSRVYPKCNFLQVWFEPEQSLPPLSFTVDRTK